MSRSAAPPADERLGLPAIIPEAGYAELTTAPAVTTNSGADVADAARLM
jgi:hypothetical protein